MSTVSSVGQQAAIPVVVINPPENPVCVKPTQEERRIGFSEKAGNVIGAGIERAAEQAIASLALGALFGGLSLARDLWRGNPQEQARKADLAHEEMLISLGNENCGGLNFNDPKIREAALNALVTLKHTDSLDYKIYREHFARCSKTEI